MKVTETKYGDLYGSCDLSKYQSVYLLMGEIWFEIPPSVYVESGVGKCFIQLGSNQADWWLLGDTFLRNYYSVWDSPNH